MENDEIANMLDLHPYFTVELIDFPLVVGSRRKQFDQPDDAVLDKMDAGGLQRLQKAAGQPKRDAIPVPLP